MEVIDYRFGSNLVVLMRRHFRGMLRGLTLKKSANSLVFLLEKAARRSHSSSHPFYIKIEPTNVCDHACPECPSLTDRKKGYMDLGLYKEIIDYFKPYCLRNCLYGQGESFLHKDIFEMIEYSEKNRCPVSISSNFNYMNSEEKIKKLLDSGLNYLIVCVDGATQETHSAFRRKGSLEKVLANLTMLMKMKTAGGYKHPRVEVQTIMTEASKNEMDQVTQMVRDIGVDAQTIRFDTNILNRKKRDDAQEICPYLWGSVFLTWDGKVAFCEVDYIGDDLILTDFASLKNNEKYWNSPKFQHARSLFRKHRPSERIGIRCEYCKFFPLPGTVKIKKDE
jgi:hypothetical protein